MFNLCDAFDHWSESNTGSDSHNHYQLCLDDQLLSIRSIMGAHLLGFKRLQKINILTGY